MLRQDADEAVIHIPPEVLQQNLSSLPRRKYITQKGVKIMFGATVLTANARELFRKVYESSVRQEKK